MEVLDALTNIVRTCARVLKVGAGIQEQARKRLVDDLQQTCSAAEDSFGAVLERLLPLKAASGDPRPFALELHAFRADQATRAAFKPDHLCGRVDQLLVDLKGNLNALKYSVDVGKLDQIASNLGAIGRYDRRFYENYDELTGELDRLAFKIEDLLKTNRPNEAQEAADAALRGILVFEDELASGIEDMQAAKRRILS